jgi:double-strand break repair protein MRE11
MGLLEIRSDKKFRLKSIPFTQVRPFLYGEVSLQDLPGLDPNDPKIEEKIKDKLGRKVREMIKEARTHSEAVESAHEGKLKYRVQSPEQVLVRVRVDHLGFPAINQMRFGAQFVGEVCRNSN